MTIPEESPTMQNPRETAECPNCNGTVREPRSGDAWVCDQCARRWQEDQL